MYSKQTLKKPPVPGSAAGRRALKALVFERNILASLAALHSEMGNIFEIPLPGFNPIVLVGPEANHFVTVSARDKLLWRPNDDPVARLLRKGLLVTDRELHDDLRHLLMPPLHKQRLDDYIDSMWQITDDVSGQWQSGSTYDMLVEMRRVALLILMQTLFDVDFRPHLDRLWNSILRMLEYISPGLWIVWPKLPRFGYQHALNEVDEFLYQIIRERRASGPTGEDMLSSLVSTPEMTDDLIRDQLLTILIAGHDTSTATLAWTLFLLGKHPQSMAKVQGEVDEVLESRPPAIETVNRLETMDLVIKESLRLFPPIHIGNRMAAEDIEFQGYRIPAGKRVVYSIYLSHRHPDFWSKPDEYEPIRFSTEENGSRPHYAYVPFGGGPRNCIGAAYAQVEVKAVLARLLQQYEFQLAPGDVHPHMGATLEPRPGVKMLVRRRST